MAADLLPLIEQLGIAPQQLEVLRGLGAEELEALWKLAGEFGGQAKAQYAAPASTDLIEFGESNFYIKDTKRPIKLFDPQPLILGYMFWRGHELPFQTYMYSTVKKSGKSSVSAMVARWVAETYGSFQEVYLVANDEEQARGVLYEKLIQSFQFTPGWDERTRTLEGRWKVVDRELTHIPSRSIVKALSGDYRGQAGSEPTATFWTELWAYVKEASLRLWDELTPVPTRPHSFRFIDTYAGFEGESDLLRDLWDRGLNGRRITNDELIRACGRPWYRDGEEIPIWINETARMCAYIDQGPAARRMPWQTDEYYRAEAIDLRPEAFDRLHNNYWVSAVGEFIPAAWWEACYDPDLPDYGGENMIASADAAVSGDCCAMVGVTRDPRDDARVALRVGQKWDAPKGGSFNYQETIEPCAVDWCTRYPVLQIAYDPYQLHDMSTRLGRSEGQIAWWKPFSQNQGRLSSDFQLYCLIRDRRIRYKDRALGALIGEHIRNANSVQSSKEDTKLRIVKKGKALHIDLVVCLSMAANECLRLNM